MQATIAAIKSGADTNTAALPNTPPHPFPPLPPGVEGQQALDAQRKGLEDQRSALAVDVQQARADIARLGVAAKPVGHAAFSALDGTPTFQFAPAR